MEHLTFPCVQLPENLESLKLLGVYPQRQSGLWMQRIKVQGGILTSAQWRTLAQLCAELTPHTPLALTTRQDIEFHNVPTSVLPLLQQKLADAGLTGQGACGDTVRTITLCPGNGLCTGTPDLTDIAAAVRAEIEETPFIFELPRKFKISFSSCPQACGQPWINDLGFVAVPSDSGTFFQVIGAGSLGPRPATGIVLNPSLPARDVAVFARTVLNIFHQQGDRVHRSHARLRHVRERFGDRAFLNLVGDAFLRAETSSISANPVAVANGWHLFAEFTPPCGQIKPEHADALATISATPGCAVRLQNHHRISIYVHKNTPALTLPSIFELFVNRASIVSCPGTSFCRHALVDTHTLERTLREKLSAQHLPEIRISGCPNSCVHSAVAPMGLIGKTRRDTAGRRAEGFQILTGGGMGRTPALARSIASWVPADAVADFFISGAAQQAIISNR